MADSYIPDAPSSGEGKFTPAPEGSARAVCVDGVYLGEKVDQFPGQPTKLVKKYALVFQVDEINPETGKRFEIAREFTISMSEKANLRKFLAQWRGKPYSDEEVRAFDLARVVGACGIATVSHKVSGAGRTYGVLMSMTPLIKGMPKIEPLAYERAPYWEQRKAEYKAAADAHRAAEASASAALHRERAAMSAALGDDVDDHAAALDAVAAGHDALPF